MTALSSALGMLPLDWPRAGNERSQPLAIVVAGGVDTSPASLLASAPGSLLPASGQLVAAGHPECTLA